MGKREAAAVGSVFDLLPSQNGRDDFAIVEVDMLGFEHVEQLAHRFCFCAGLQIDIDAAIHEQISKFHAVPLQSIR